VALLFNGSTSRVTQTGTDMLSGGSFGLSFRRKTTTSTNGDITLSQFTTLVGGIRISVPAATTTFQVQIGAATNINCTIAGGTATGVWEHWFVAYDGSQATSATRLKIWKDGVAQTVSFSAAVPATIVSSAASLFLGDPAAAASFDGSLADVMIWSDVIPAGMPESQARMYRPIYTHNSGHVLFLWAPLDDGVQAADYSGRGFHASAVSNVTLSPDSPGESLGHPEMIIE
jgi:hypothetical protein